MTPPASTEPILCDHYGPCGLVQKHGTCPKDAWGIPCEHDTRARGPVQQATAEQIPNYHQCLHKEIRNGVEFCHFHDKETHPTLAEHDAALIVQEREKWEREHTKKPGCYNSCPFDDLCANDIEKIQEIERMAAARAREDVLDDLAQMYANVPEQFLEGTYRLHSEWKEKIESLRHGQKQERDPE